MISIEVLRRYPFFALFDHDQLREMAMITRERNPAPGEKLFESGSEAMSLFLLRSGNVELHYVVTDEREMEIPQDYLVGTINPGEIFGVSALIPPYRYTAEAVAAEACQVLEIDAARLRALCEEDIALAATLQGRIAEVTLKRLQDTRVQLLAT